MARSDRSSPEPSTVARPASGRSIEARSDRTTAIPFTVEPRPPRRRSSSFTSISAVWLSLSRSISPTSSPTFAESMVARRAEAGGAAPSAALPSTSTPRARNSAVNSAAAAVAGAAAAM